MKNWEKEFDEKWNSCNCEGGFDCGQCSINDNLSAIVGEESWEWLNKKIKYFISSLILSQRKEVIEECIKEMKECKVEFFNTRNKKDCVALVDAGDLITRLNKLK